MRRTVISICVIALSIVRATLAQVLQVSGPADYQWFSNSLSARIAYPAIWTTGEITPGTEICHLGIRPELTPQYRTQLSPNRVELSGRDKLALTFACLDFLDSVGARGFESFVHPPESRTWDFTSKTSARIVMLTQRPDDSWPKARTQLFNAVYYGRATEVIIPGFGTIWRSSLVPYVDEMLSLCDRYGLQARLMAGTFSKWWRGDVPTGRCLRASIPTRGLRNPPDAEQLLDPASYASRPVVAGNSDSNRVYIHVDFPRDDDTFRLWQVTCKLRADSSTPTARGRFMWYRNDRYADPNTDAVEVWVDYPLLTMWLTFRDTVNSLEQIHWIAHFQSTEGRLWVDSVRVVEINPSRWDSVACSCDTLLNGWYRYQKSKLSTYLKPMSLRPERDSSMIVIGQTMDSCYAHFHNHPSCSGFFSSCDEVWVMGWDPLFMRTYANAGEGYVDLLRKVAHKAHSLFPSGRLLFFGDMLDPYHNAKVYTRACNPRGGGFLNSRHCAEPDTSQLDILLWGEENPTICRALLDTFRVGWTWTAGISTGNRAKEEAAWQPRYPSRVCYFDWGDQFFTPAVMNDLKNHWYR